MRKTLYYKAMTLTSVACVVTAAFSEEVATPWFRFWSTVTKQFRVRFQSRASSRALRI